MSLRVLEENCSYGINAVMTVFGSNPKMRGSQLQAPTVSITGMDVVGERVTAKASNLPEGAIQVSYQWQYSSTKTGTFSDIKYGGIDTPRS